MNRSSSFSESPVICPDRIINAKSGDFCEQFNRSAFEFSHNLTGHPLFELPRLVELAKTIAQQNEIGKIFCGNNDIPVHRKWGEWAMHEQVAEAITNIQESKSWILLADAQIDPEYSALLSQIMSELESLTGCPLKQDLRWLGGYIFIASPGSLTPYHIDSEINFLFQIQGDKNVNLFNPADRSILSAEEIEQFYMGNVGAATYRAENQTKAKLYQLTEGKGVHQPTLAPHWVKTGDRVSIALSILIYLESSITQANIYQFNHYLRKLGLKPTQPGQSGIRDRIKAASIRAISKPNPQTKAEIIRSGVTRINSLVGQAARLVRR